MNSLVCVRCQEYVFYDPYQCDCGDRLCSKCYTSYVERGQMKFDCLFCGKENSLANCFRDKAVERELQSTTLKCLNPSCPWEGESRLYQIHVQKECEMAQDYCPNKCGKRLPKREMKKHTRSVCTRVRECNYKDLGCIYKGTIKDLTKHAKKYPAYHNQLLKMATKEMKQTLEHQIVLINNQIALMNNQMSQLQLVTDAVIKAESVVIIEQDRLLSEVSLLLQTLVSSYDGTFIWKTPEVTRRRQEAKTGKIVSLCSAPFYTSRHGYKLCLRLYMNGAGTGKGTHVSFFITLMRGEYDALLPWPFRQAVTLSLVDQNKQRDIVQSFCPEPTSSSFQRPRNEINVASGCPTFALVSVLDDVSYVKDDTLFLKCAVNTSGL